MTRCGGLDATTSSATSWTERGFFRIAGFAAPETCAAMLERVTDVVRDPGLAGELGVKVVPESNKAGVAVAHPEDGVSKIFKLHRDTVFADFAHSAEVVDLVSRAHRARHRRLPVAVHLQDGRRLGPALAPGLLLLPVRAGAARRRASGWP